MHWLVVWEISPDLIQEVRDGGYHACYNYAIVQAENESDALNRLQNEATFQTGLNKSVIEFSDSCRDVSIYHHLYLHREKND